MAAMRAERVEKLRMMITGLPEGKKKAVLEALLAGKTYAQAASATGVSISRVGQILAEYTGRIRRTMSKPQTAVSPAQPAGVAVSPPTLRTVEVPAAPRITIDVLARALTTVAVQRLIRAIEGNPQAWAGECIAALRRTG